jgi:hypothetical protein
VVPFCHHTTGKHHGAQEWICAEHWRAVPKRLRQKHRLAERKQSKAKFWTWRECKRAAIEAAGGLR